MESLINQCPIEFDDNGMMIFDIYINKVYCLAMKLSNCQKFNRINLENIKCYYKSNTSLQLVSAKHHHSGFLITP